MGDIVLIDKFDKSHFIWKNLERHKKLDRFSVEAVVDKFNGFEGDLVDLFPVNKGSDYCSQLEAFNSNGPLILYVQSMEAQVDPIVRSQFSFIGYDFGICEKGATNYSSIFNELLFGSTEALANFRDQLNESLLFQGRALAKDYAKVHHELWVAGKDVENEDYMKIYEIWKFNKCI